jgi:hypothetical protein
MQVCAQHRLAPDAAIAAQDQRLHALVVVLVAEVHSRIRRAGEANRWAAKDQTHFIELTRLYQKMVKSGEFLLLTL